MPALAIDDVTVRYGKGDTEVTPLDEFAADVSEGMLAVLLGPSGCGKTTLLSCVSGIQRPTAGRIAFGDIDITALDAAGLNEFRRSTVGIVFQGFNLIPSLNALENVMVPLRAASVPRARGAAPSRGVARGGRSRRTHGTPPPRALGWSTAAGGDRAGAGS